MDYNPISIELGFDAGEIVPTFIDFSIDTVNDDLNEPTEMFTVSLSAPSGAVLGAGSTASITITDDDGKEEGI